MLTRFVSQTFPTIRIQESGFALGTNANEPDNQRISGRQLQVISDPTKLPFSSSRDQLIEEKDYVRVSRNVSQEEIMDTNNNPQPAQRQDNVEPNLGHTRPTPQESITDDPEEFRAKIMARRRKIILRQRNKFDLQARDLQTLQHHHKEARDELAEKCQELKSLLVHITDPIVADDISKLVLELDGIDSKLTKHEDALQKALEPLVSTNMRLIHLENKFPELEDGVLGHDESTASVGGAIESSVDYESDSSDTGSTYEPPMHPLEAQYYEAVGDTRNIREDIHNVDNEYAAGEQNREAARISGIESKRSELSYHEDYMRERKQLEQKFKAAVDHAKQALRNGLEVGLELEEEHFTPLPPAEKFNEYSGPLLGGHEQAIWTKPVPAQERIMNWMAATKPSDSELRGPPPLRMESTDTDPTPQILVSQQTPNVEGAEDFEQRQTSAAEAAATNEKSVETMVDDLRVMEPDVCKI